MKITSCYNQGEYCITEYENGTVVKEIITNVTEQPKQYSQQEIVNAQILTQLEYLTCLQEINSLKGGNL